MKLSTKGKYGLIAMADLGTAYREDGRYMVLKTIATKRNISEPYLERLVAKLKKAGFITTQRGVNGGYRLTKPPEEITVSDVLFVLEGPLDIINCGEKGNDCSCVSQVVCKEITDKINEVIDKKTIADLMAQVSREGKTDE